MRVCVEGRAAAQAELPCFSGRLGGGAPALARRSVPRRGACAGPRRLRVRASVQAQQAHVSKHADLYSGDDTPVTEFGFSRGLLDKYELGDRVGAGTFGTVYAATEKATGKRVAVKSMAKRVIPGGGGVLEQYYVRRVRNEVDICTHLGRSLNVCYFFGAYEDDRSVHLVMELCSGGQLWDKIKLGSYSEVVAARLVREILRTVAQCHADNVMIRDVKPENFLFAGPEADAPLKAIDFGISIFCQPGQYVDLRAGTPIFIAPEVLRNRYTLSADLWSVGIVAYQLLTGRLPFAGEEGLEVSELYMTKQVYDNKDVFRAVLYSDLDFELPPWDTISTDARDLVQSLLQRDEALRPTAEAALAHPWLQEGSAAVPGAPLGGSIVQRLQRFGTYGRLKQVALRRVAHSIAADSALLSDLRSSFVRLDASGSGRVTYAALAAALRDGQFELSVSEAEQLLAAVDMDDNGLIDYDEWVAAMADWRTIQDSAEWEDLVADAFEALDPSHSGRIGAAELEALLCGDEGCEMPDTVSAALREADADHDGRISLADFRALLASHRGDRLSLYDARLPAPPGAEGGGAAAE